MSSNRSNTSLDRILQSAPGPVQFVRGPFGGIGKGTLKRHDLERFYDLVGKDKSPDDPEGALLMAHIQIRLAKALGDEHRDDADKYTELVREVKALRKEQEQQGEEGDSDKVKALLLQMKSIEERVFPPPTCSCAGCSNTKSTTTTSSGNLLLCACCKSVKYCSRDCQKADWKAHKPGCKAIVKNIELVDAQAVHKEHPDTFEVPEEDEIRDLEPGMYAKVCILSVKGQQYVPHRVWLWIDTVLDDGTFIGKLSNWDPRLKLDDRIQFKSHQIYAIQTEAQQKAIAAEMMRKNAPTTSQLRSRKDSTKY